MAAPIHHTTGPTLLVVIDHREAKVYRTETHPAARERIVPYDPHGYGRHLHSAHEWTDGERVPECKSDYVTLAKTLSGAGRIVVFGGGTGRSSAMDRLMADLTDHHPAVAARVVASVVVNAHHTTEHQLRAEARASCANCELMPAAAE